MPTPSEGWPRRRIVPLAALVLAAAGCGQPQVEPEHRELVLRLATATSTQDRAALDRAAEVVERLDAEGALGVDQRDAFTRIIDHARDGDWERAQRLAYDLRDAQRPTTEDIERVKNRTMPEPQRTYPPPSGY
ncbi:hypothetical protein [Tautonia sociabilis]|uniref:Uncharacterized protein n=1 Tax=Tautonia sociabilis TaxID=2080755 RepID=A0A432MDJ4_9BACT|nr:hypothetical protein [Tautonia sociabilis]RUL82805.1 hypothetical protein TsocGM_23185 [Tautonia sociabilis]